MMTKIPVRSWRLASAVGLVAIVSALAAAPAFASCFAPGQQPKATVVELQASLASLLGGDADKNAGAIIATVRDLAAADPGSLSFILTKLGDASDAQRSSIGTGLGQAATICQRTDLAFATDIQTQLLAVDESIDNKAAETAFALATGQSPIGATAAGGGGQLGSYSTPTASGTSAFQSLGTYSTKTTINLFTIGGNGSTSYTYSPIVKSVSSP
jgi:hypothetical protein